ncbi:MAG: DUF4242 domain-containing protein [Oceanospirillaceae bacterium]|nr:DUF4242 domain-containing protein [Oceanospirillaceae bacterium]
MNTYAIRRRGNWANTAELEAAAAKSTRVGNEEMPDSVRWIRSYVVQEEDGRLGTLCIYEATDEQAIDEHAFRVGMSADEILPVKATVVVRADPEEKQGQAA